MDSRQGVLTGLYVLVVDDDLDAREILSSVLGYFGAFVTVSKGVADARRLLHEVAPDVVLADMRLGGSDGFRLLNEARKERNYTPFIAISGQDFDPEELQDAGFAAYLRKPLDHVRLVDTILAVIRDR